MQQRRAEFLDEGVKYYSEDTKRRATNTLGGCEYLTKRGKKCFIGRHITDFSLLENLDLKAHSLDNSLWDGFCQVLPTNVIELGLRFLIDVQHLHDCSSYWGKKGLSKEGIEALERIKAEYCV